jgi:hypothetical protein
LPEIAFFPQPWLTDDTFVANELSLPTFQAIRIPGDQPTKTFDLSADVALKLTPNFGIEMGDGYQFQKAAGSNLHTGFHNLEVGAKYQFLVNAEHEEILSLGGRAEIGGTGSKAIGADRFSTIVPGFFFGKGFGDLPDSLWVLRPFALTGQVGVSFPTRSNVGDAQVPNNLEWGFALEYSLIYLQGQVKDIGLRAPFDRLIPLVEFLMESPLNRGGTPTTGTINPGVIWSGKYFQIGVEAVFPINRHTGNNVGVLANCISISMICSRRSSGAPCSGGEKMIPHLRSLLLPFVLWGTASVSWAHAFMDHAEPAVGS